MMIKITNLNKHFNKGSSNEIHVINDTTLEFPETGLVSITGPSGCGKTTLLNVIGGLDSFEKGIIDFDGQEIKRYNPLRWDVLRNHYIGYIFQNYNLIEDKTVYENIEISLNMAGLYNQEEIDERINYVLEAVGMRNYRKRSVLALSGGQRQRVGIARALAKNPKVILADEPTGNLDANNTFEVMSIIKKISQTCLVILVSHEKSLVDFYSDRVIQISDGLVIKDYINESSGSIDRIDERDIYLKDLSKDDLVVDSNIERYYETDKDETLGFTVVEVKNSIYIKANTNSKKKIKYITDDTEINLIDDHYKSRKADEALEYSFDMHKYGEIERNQNKKSFIRLRDSFAQGFRKVTGKRKFIGKLFLLVYFVISSLVVFQLATFGNLNKIEETDFLHSARDMLLVETEGSITSIEVNNLLLDEIDGLEIAPYQYTVSLELLFHDFYQGEIQERFSGFPMKSSWVNEEDIIYGRMPENNSEIVLDKWVVEELFKSQGFSDLNITNSDELIWHDLVTNNSYGLGFKIVGIIDTNSPIVVVEDEAIYSFLNYYSAAYGSYEGKIDILAGGREIQASDEVLVPVDTGILVGESLVIDGDSYEVVGRFTLNSDYYTPFTKGLYQYILPNDYFDELIVTMRTQEASNPGGSYVLFYSENLEDDISYVEENRLTYDAYGSYDYFYNLEVEANQDRIEQRVMSILITLGGIVVYIFFMMRSSMLNRIKEIGTYRAIGATKRDIHKIFVGEIFWFTTLGSMPGYIVMTLLINNIQNTLGDLVSVFYFPITYFIGGIIGIYLINFIFGMLPVANLLRKTPSQINAKFDI